MAKLPEYLASIEFSNPSDPENSLFHYSLGTKLNMFQWLKTQPEQLIMFSEYNAAATRLQASSLKATISALFPKVEPVTTVNAIDATENQVMIVDVGAGRGQLLKEFRRERPDLVGRMIAQDLPEVIAGIALSDGVETMCHGFFEPQPVEGPYDFFRKLRRLLTLPLGASVYFFRHILHNWPDGACRQILTNTTSALTPN